MKRDQAETNIKSAYIAYGEGNYIVLHVESWWSVTPNHYY